MDHTTLLAAIEDAFQYRGHVTLVLHAGEAIEGFLFNRVVDADARHEPPFVEILRKGTSERVKICVSECARLEKTGEDCAAGKSYQEWLAKEKNKLHAANE